MNQSEPTQSEIDLVIRSLEVRQKTGEGVRAVCPSCGRDHFHVNTSTGKCHCKRPNCGFAGGLFRLATALGIRVREQEGPDFKGMFASNRTKAMKRPLPGGSRFRTKDIERAEAALWSESGEKGLAYLRGRGFTDATIRHHRLGWSKKLGGVLIPVFDNAEGACLVKVRSLDSNLRWQRHPKGAKTPLFGGLQVEHMRQVILVEGEWDAMALWQLGWDNVASSTAGSGSFPEFGDYWLRDAEEIIVWYDDDEAGLAGREKILERYGHRVRFVDMPEDLGLYGLEGEAKDVNDLLKLGATHEMIESILAKARAPVANSSQTIAEFVRDFARKRRSAVDQGARVEPLASRFHPWDELVGGLHPGDLHILTGHPGFGKSVLSEYLVECYAQQGHQVVWSSLENSDEQTMARLEARLRLHGVVDKITAGEDPEPLLAELGDAAHWSHRVQLLTQRSPWTARPQTWDQILAAAEYLARVKGAGLWVIDHLGLIGSLMLSSQDKIPFDYERQQQSFQAVAASQLVEFAREVGIAILLLVHPKNMEDRTTILEARHLARTADLERLASTITSLNRPPNDTEKGRQVKFRFDGKRKSKDYYVLTPGDVLLWGSKSRDAGGSAKSHAIIGYSHPDRSFFAHSAPLADDDEFDDLDF